MNKLVQILVATLALSTLVVNNDKVMAQPPGTPNTSSSSSDPSLAECRAEYGREICQPSSTGGGGGGDRRIIHRTHWYVVVGGNLEGSRQHGELETDYGHTEYGIGGSAECPEGTVPLVIAASGLRYLHDEAGHTFTTGTFCAPLGTAQSGSTINIDVSQFVTVEMFETLVHRLEADERTLFLHMCEGYDVSWEEWFAATPEHREELCPSQDGRQNARLDRIEDRLDNLPANTGSGVRANLGGRFGAQLMGGSSIDSTPAVFGLGTAQMDLFGRRDRHGFSVRGEYGIGTMNGTQGSPAIRQTMIFGGSLAYALHLGPHKRLQLNLGGRLLGMATHSDNPSQIHGYRGMLTGPEIAVMVDFPIRERVAFYLRASASYLYGPTIYWVNGHPDRANRTAVMFGLEAGFHFGR